MGFAISMGRKQAVKKIPCSSWVQATAHPKYQVPTILTCLNGPPGSLQSGKEVLNVRSLNFLKGGYLDRWSGIPSGFRFRFPKSDQCCYLPARSVKKGGVDTGEGEQSESDEGKMTCKLPVFPFTILPALEVTSRWESKSQNMRFSSLVGSPLRWEVPCTQHRSSTRSPDWA